MAGNRVTLLKTAELYKLLVASVRDYAIFALDTNGVIITWNEGARRLKGYEASEIIGKHFSIFYAADAVAAAHPQWELEVAAAEGRYEEEGWRLRKDGTRFWANVVITALRDETNALVGFAKVTRDLTERKMSEQALRLSEERFRLLVNSVRDYGIFVLDPQGNIVSWNVGAERLKGYTADEIIGKHFSVFYPDEDLRADKPGMELREAARVGRYEDEGWRLRKDGTRFWANVVISAMRNEAGELVGYAKVTRDLTERRLSEARALEDAMRVAEAEAANRAKSQFLAAMSHELRTPLNAIAGYTELLALEVHGQINAKQRESLHRIRTAQSHLLGLITDLLNYSRLEAGRVNYDIGVVRLSDVAETVESMIAPQAAARGVQVTWQMSDHSVSALADKAKVEQILLNLLTNAVKFTPNDGKIEVHHFLNGHWATIEVTDNGVGIPEDKTDAIFEPFVQVGRSLTSAHEGAGLGLAISRDLARAMGGDLKVRSKIGVGSTFILTLPTAD